MFTFHIADYIVGAIVLLVPVLIGVFFAVRDVDKATREEYLMGGRQMSMLPVSLSLFITFVSAISQIGVPTEVYSFGSMIIILSIGLALSYPIGIYTVVPLMYPLRLNSIYEYLHMRYRSNTVRLLSTLLGMLTTICYLSVALLSPALALQASAGIPLWISVVIVGGIGTIYTTMGGIKSVIWTDAFQTIIVFIGVITIIVKGISSVGSVEEVWRLAHEHKRTTFDTVDLDPRTRHTYWSCIIGGCFLWLVNSFNQSSLQRICAMKSLRDAKTCFLLNAPLQVIYHSILVVIGNIVFAYIAHTQCDPYKAGIVTNTNQLAPYFVLETTSDLSGMAGLYVSILCCGSLSTLSSGINSLAANTVEDILRRPLKNVREGTATLITKIFVLFYGTAIVAIAYGAKSVQGPVTQMAGSVFGACGSPVLGIFLAGACVPWVNKYGALIGCLVSIIFNLWISIGNRLYGSVTVPFESVTMEKCFPEHVNNASYVSANTTWLPVHDVYGASQYLESSTIANVSLRQRDYGFFLFDVSYEWYGLIGTILCVSLTLVISLMTRQKKETRTTDPMLIFPILRRYWGMPEPAISERNVDDIEIKYPLSDTRLTTENNDF